MKCEQVLSADGVWWHCPHCKVSTRTPQSRECGPLLPLRNAPFPIANCQHLGSQTGERNCPTCAGNVRLKVFACSHPLHRETTLPECSTCRDFAVAANR